MSVTDLDAGRRTALKKFGVRVGADNRAAVRDADVIVLCVKPQQMPGLLAELAGVVKRALVISIAAGVRTDRIEKALGKVPVIRVMPNTPALLRAGALVYTSGRHAGRRHEATARKILSALGLVWKVSEPQMDAVTALSGSGPAYVFYLAECLAAAGTALGLAPDLAEALAGKIDTSGVIASAEAYKPGFVNIRLTSQYLLGQINSISEQGVQNWYQANLELGLHDLTNFIFDKRQSRLYWVVW
jgi:pyrroline-5-carboxylate reductase